MRHIFFAALLALLSCVCLAQPGTPNPGAAPAPAPTPKPAPPRPTWWEKILIAAGVISTPGGQKGEEEKPPRTGNIFIANLRSSFEPASSRRVTTAGGFRSPIILAGGTHILAVKGDKIVRVAILDGAVEDVETVPGIYKLVGQSGANADDILVLLHVGGETCFGVAMFSLRTKQLTLIPRGNTGEDDAGLSHLLGWERVYDDGNITLDEEIDEVGDAENKTKQSNVFLRRGTAKVKISDCKGKNCIHPTLLLANPRMAAYVEQE